MKNIIISLFVIMIFAVNVNAQFLGISVKGGYNISDVSGNFPTETKTKSGFNLYVSKDIVNFLVFSALGEAGYTQKGFRQDFIETNAMGQQIGTYEIKYKLDYIDISILGKVKVPAVVFAPYFVAGPSFGIKVSNSVSSDNSAISQNQQQFDAVVDNFNSTSFGMKFGIGADITALPLMNIFGEARYNIDFADAYEQGNVRLKNKVFEFILGVTF